MDAGDGDLAVTGILHACDLRENVRDGPAAPGTARTRDNAIRARLIAAGLHAQRKCGTSGESRRDRCAAAAVTARESLRGRKPRKPNLLRQMLLAIVGNNLHDAGKTRYLLRPPR